MWVLMRARFPVLPSSFGCTPDSPFASAQSMYVLFMPIPVISIAQMREWEKATWATGQTEAEVIRRVGKCVARRALGLTRPGDLVLILAGKGHNGEDARSAREHLLERRADVLEVTEPAADVSRLEARV